jgi:hypothetical protein
MTASWRPGKSNYEPGPGAPVNMVEVVELA